MRTLRAFGIAVLAVGFITAPALAQVFPGSTIDACVHTGDRHFRVVPSGEPCKNNETRIQWTVVGPQGPKGDTGATGAQGPQGPVGLDGSQGPTGPQGAKGEQGPAGAQGPIGPAGEQGLQGVAGEPGPKGETGATGAVGPQGPVGAAGSQGPTGPQGIQGPDGSAGPKGPTSTVAGQTGPQGDAGPAGPALPTGGIMGSLTCAQTPVNAGTIVYLAGNGFTVITGQELTFQMDNVPAGSYTLAVEREGGVLVATQPVVVGDAMVDLGAVTVCN